LGPFFPVTLDRPSVPLRRWAFRDFPRGFSSDSAWESTSFPLSPSEAFFGSGRLRLTSDCGSSPFAAWRGAAWARGSVLILFPALSVPFFPLAFLTYLSLAPPRPCPEDFLRLPSFRFVSLQFSFCFLFVLGYQEAETR